MFILEENGEEGAILLYQGTQDRPTENGIGMECMRKRARWNKKGRKLMVVETELQTHGSSLY